MSPARMCSWNARDDLAGSPRPTCSGRRSPWRRGRPPPRAVASWPPRSARRAPRGPRRPLVVAPRDVGHEDEPLPPVVEHHRPVDHQQADRRARRLGRMWRRVPVEQRGRLVGEVAHQPAGERGEIGETRAAERVRRRTSASRGDPERRRLEGHLSNGVLDTQAVRVQHDRRGRVAGDERVPTPALGSLHRFEEDPRPVAGDRGEQPDGGGDVGEQLGPHGDDRPLASERVERGSVRSDPEVRSQRSLPIVSGDGQILPVKEGTPGVAPGLVAIGAKGSSAAVPGPEGAEGPSSRSATSRRSAPLDIVARWSHLDSPSVNGLLR